MAAQDGMPGGFFPGGPPGNPPAGDGSIYADGTPPTGAETASPAGMPPAAGPTNAASGPALTYVPSQPNYASPSQPGYGSPNSPSYGVPTPPSYGGPAGQVRGRRRFRRKHYFRFLIAVVLLIAVAQVLVSPWAFHIGGHFTPLGKWSGAAQGKAPDGDRYAVQLNLTFTPLDERACRHSCNDFHGSMIVCTPAGRYTLNNMNGVLHGWLSTEDRTMTIDFGPSRSQSNFQQEMQVIGALSGTWHGNVFQATDGGYLERDFQPDGTPRQEVTSPDPTKAVALAFTLANFDAMCASLKHT